MNFFGRFLNTEPHAEAGETVPPDNATLTRPLPPRAPVRMSIVAPAGMPPPAIQPLRPTGGGFSPRTATRSIAIPETAVAVLDALPALADQYALLMKDTSKPVWYLLVLETKFSSGAAQTLRQELAKDCPILHMVPVNSERLSEYRSMAETVTGKSVGSAKSSMGRGLNVTRGLELIQEAIRLDASDLHIDVWAEGRKAPMVAIRYRVHGKIHTHKIEKTQRAVEHMVETMRGLYQDEEICSATTRQGGTTFNYPVTHKYEGSLKPPVQGAELRLEIMPEKEGFFAVMRLIGHDGKSAARKTLQELGLSSQQEIDLLRAGKCPHGLNIVVGATGQGKTTTITTVLSLDKDAEHKRRISLEIPPEADIAWLSQVPTNEKLLPEHMDGVLRSDPDVISAGEMRNSVTSRFAQESALTGHLTWVTFHSNGVFAAFLRMIKSGIGMDVDILTMDRFLRSIMCQSLVSVLCNDCKKPAVDVLTREQQHLLSSKFGLDISSMYVSHQHDGEGHKCAACGGTGTIGRTVVAELVVPTREILKFIAVSDIPAAEMCYRQQRTTTFTDPDTTGKTILEHALYKASAGITCSSELFDMENLWTYEIVPLRSAESPGATILQGVSN